MTRAWPLWRSVARWAAVSRPGGKARASSAFFTSCSPVRVRDLGEGGRNGGGVAGVARDVHDPFGFFPAVFSSTRFSVEVPWGGTGVLRFLYQVEKIAVVALKGPSLSEIIPAGNNHPCHIAHIAVLEKKTPTPDTKNNTI